MTELSNDESAVVPSLDEDEPPPSKRCRVDHAALLAEEESGTDAPSAESEGEDEEKSAKVEEIQINVFKHSEISSVLSWTLPEKLYADEVAPKQELRVKDVDDDGGCPPFLSSGAAITTRPDRRYKLKQLHAVAEKEVRGWAMQPIKFFHHIQVFKQVGKRDLEVIEGVKGREWEDIYELPRWSAFGDKRLLIPAAMLFDPQKKNLYFADFYCMNSRCSPHYVTLVLAEKGSQHNAYCKQTMLPLVPGTNPFLQANKGPNGQLEFSETSTTDIWVIMYNCGDWHADPRWIEVHLEDVGKIGDVARGSHNTHCRSCNI